MTIDTDAETAIVLRPMRWWDIDPVLALEGALFAEDAWSPGLFWSELGQLDRRHYLVAIDGRGAVIGYAGLADIGSEGYIQTIGVAPDHWGRGIGTALLAALLAEAERRRLASVVLEVRADNDRARQLYERFGFVGIGVRRGYYQPSGVDAVVMIRQVQ
jgi:ribosomal-protein-alanine N-acetyltransferase